MSITTVEVNEIVTAALSKVPGVKYYDAPPAKVTSKLALVSYLETMQSQDIGSGTALGGSIWNFHLMVLTPRVKLPDDYKKVLEAMDNVKKAVAEELKYNNQLSANLTFNLVPQDYGETIYLSFDGLLVLTGF